MARKFEELEETEKVVKSGTSAIHLCGDDYNRIDEFVRRLASMLRFADIVEWNYGYGQVDFETRKIPEEKTSFQEFLKTYRDKVYAENRIILIRNARHVLEGEMNRENLARLQQTIVHLKKFLPGNAVLIYCDEKKFIPDELSSLVYFLDIKPPSQEELEEIIREFVERKQWPEPDPNLVNKLSLKCVGMSEDSFTQILEKAALDNDEQGLGESVLPMADKTKKQFVDKSELLKYVNTDVKIENVGGLDFLKWWLRQKEKAFKDPKGAKDRGITPAKGILLVGMPGCGKSLTSKAVAGFFNYPMLQLDLGSLMGKYLGESEENLRRALKLAENSSPCVLWVDEIEKAFAGVSGDESGVSQRLLGYLLTWLNEKTAQVFVMATANDVAVLPPEFLRRGRFDEIFYVDFPNAPERKEIFRIHLAKAFGEKKKIYDLLAAKENFRKDFDELTGQGTEGYAGSDIEALVNSAIERAWNKGQKPEEEIFSILLSERKYMKPLKEVLAEKIARNKKKFGEYKLTSASETNLQSLETDSDSTKEEDLLGVANNERCPEYLLIRVANKGAKEVKLAVLKNPNCPFECIIALMKDADPDVKAKAEEKQSATPEGMIRIAREGSKEQKLKLLSLSSIPDAALEVLVEDTDSDVAAGVMQYRFLPEKVLNRLVERARSIEELREKIIALRDCPQEIKENLLIERNMYNCAYYYKSNRNYWCNKDNRILYGGEQHLCGKCAKHMLKYCKNCAHFDSNEYENVHSTKFCKKGQFSYRGIVEDAQNNKCYAFEVKR